MVNWLDRPFERRILGFDFMPSLFSLLRRLTPNCADPSFASHPFSALNGAITGTLVSVPQTMAYGLLVGGVLGGAWAGIGVLAALYSAVLVGLTSAILGGSPVTVAGPRATTALVFAALVAQLGQNPALDGLPDPEAIAVALGCAAVMLSGLIQVALGGLRLGRLARYIPHPVIAGFLNGSALLVLASQVWVATGIPQAGAAPAILGHLDQLQPGTLLLTFATTAVILLTPKLTRRIPPPLVGLVLGTAAYHILAALDGGAALGGTLAPLPDHFALHLIVAELVGGEPASPLLCLAVEAEETGSGVPQALCGRHFSDRAALGEAVPPGEVIGGGASAFVAVPARGPDGALRDGAEIEAELDAQVLEASQAGRRVLLTVAEVGCRKFLPTSSRWNQASGAAMASVSPSTAWISATA